MKLGIPTESLEISSLIGGLHCLHRLIRSTTTVLECFVDPDQLDIRGEPNLQYNVRKRGFIDHDWRVDIKTRRPVVSHSNFHWLLPCQIAVT